VLGRLVLEALQVNVRELIADHEGEVNHAYTDSLGYLTIGVGRLIDKRMGGHITHDEAMYLLDNDIEKCRVFASKIPWFAALDEVRQAAILDLIFNLGETKFMKFAQFRMAMSVKDYPWAAEELKDSLWYRQVKRRGPRIVSMILTGEWPK
jgi:lysozyme